MSYWKGEDQPTFSMELRIPAVRLQSMIMARHEEIQAQVQAKIDRMFEDGSIEAMIAREVEKTLEKIIREGIESSFKYGSGIKAVVEPLTQLIHRSVVDILASALDKKGQKQEE